MTTCSPSNVLTASERPQSPLPFAEGDLLSVRLLPAEFARAVGVSKQSVSRWIKQGVVTLGADGRLDPRLAMRQLLRNGNPGRLRARLVRQAYADMADLRAEAGRAIALDQELAAATARLQYLDGYSRELDRAAELAVDVLVGEIGSIRAARNETELREIFADLLERALLLAGAELCGINDVPAFAGAGYGNGQVTDEPPQT